LILAAFFKVGLNAEVITTSFGLLVSLKLVRSIAAATGISSEIASFFLVDFFLELIFLEPLLFVFFAFVFFFLETLLVCCFFFVSVRQQYRNK